MEGLDMNAYNSDASQVMEAIVRARKAKLNINGSSTNVTYTALDILKLFMESNFCKTNRFAIRAALSRRALESIANDDNALYWKIIKVTSLLPGLIEDKEVREILCILRAHKIIDCDEAGDFFVTEYGKEMTNNAIIAMDSANS